MGVRLCKHVEDRVDNGSKKSSSVLSCMRHYEKQSGFFTCELRSPVDYRLNYKTVVFPIHRPGFEIYQSRYLELEVMNNLQKLFTLAGCLRETKMTPISELTGIVSELNSCGILHNENYFAWENEDNETLLEIAIKAGNTVMVGLLIEGGDDDMHSCAFVVACRMGKKEIVKVLLNSNAHVYLDLHVQTDCVNICTRHGYKHLLSMLCEFGFCLSNSNKFVDLKSPQGTVVPPLWKMQTNGSLLHVAAGNGHHQIMDYLITHKTDIDLVDSSGRKPIHLAVQGGICCLMTLLRAGVNIEATDSKGRTSLFLAASFGNLQVVRFLLNNGANIDSENNLGVSVLLAAAFSNQDTTVKYLLDNGAAIRGVRTKQLDCHNSGTVLPAFIDNGTLYGTEQEIEFAILRKLEETGNVLPWARISLHFGMNPEIILCTAIHKGNQDVMKLMIEMDVQQNTAMLALSCSSLRIVKYIILNYIYSERLKNSFLMKALQ